MTAQEDEIERGESRLRSQRDIRETEDDKLKVIWKSGLQRTT